MSAESNENDGHETSLIPINHPPPRTPLNTIPDPAQVAKAINTPKVSSSNNINNRNAKSEPNSTSSTPCRANYKAGSSSRKGVSSWTAASECNNAEVQSFELQEDSSFWRHHNVQVMIRTRPFNSLERIARGYGSCLRQESNQTLVWLGHPETRFTFDHVACETISQDKLFRVAGLPMVENCMSGYNSCVFAYGQTGSGKTYTMMGDIHDMEVKLSEDCGITARIFEYLFRRIGAEEESRKDERLKYSCKCSFLEIYNEQITDLLEPSSTNLQLREDMEKGVYVENLKEYSVITVNDVIKLLLQGAANRKMAATHMNSESSRSHSVFTCIIESQWDNDSMTHFRYARLNLVDLAGSERQKTSGAEGDRLKEAANINKSLSTLGMVIMSLVDMAHGKQRHVPYRDSRLTFLLQDSLGGNSKTMIIANVSPSICSANETLSTLKFAQRAKLIQNNAKVNEDASGDISALQRQIHMLKGQLSLLMNNHEPEKSFPCSGSIFEDSVFNVLPKECGVLKKRTAIDYHDILSDQTKKTKRLEALLVAALRREKMGETTIQKLEAEIEHMNNLAHQRDEDAQRTKMLVRFREGKIKHLELLREGSFSADAYLREENSTLLEEMKLLQAKIDRNPEVTRFALENIRLLEHLQMFQNFYEQGERETLLSEVSELRDQLLQTLEMQLKSSPNLENQHEGIIKERRCCKEMNSKLTWEIDELPRELTKYVTTSQAALNSVPASCNQAECIQPDYCSLVDSISVRSDPGDEVMLHNMAGSWALSGISDSMTGVASDMQPTDTQKELEDARLIIQAMESERLCLVEKLQVLQEDNKRYVEILRKREEIQKQSMLDSESLKLGTLRNQCKDLMRESDSDINGGVLKAKLDSMSKDLEQVMLLNNKFQEEHLLQLLQQQQVELVCDQVETEMTKTIIHLQEEVTSLQLELKERVIYMNQENIRLQDTVAGKEDEIRSLSLEWEKATLELTNFLANGSKSLNEASSQIESIASLFSQVDVQICEQVERAVKVCIDKEQTILLLQKNLEEAQNMVHEMEQKFNSLKGATIALNQITQLDGNEYSKEMMSLKMLLNEKTNMIELLETKLKYMEDKIIEAENSFCALPTVGGKPSQCHDAAAREEDKDDLGILECVIPDDIKRTEFNTRSSAELVSPDDITAQIELARLEVLESENAIRAFYADAEVFFTSLQADICRTSSSYSELIQGLVEDIQATRKHMNGVKKNPMHTQFSTFESLPLESQLPKLVDNQQVLLLQVRDGLTETNERLNILENSINSILNVYVVPMMEENRWSIDCSLGSELSTPSVTSESNVGILSPTCFSRSPSNTSQGEVNLKFEGTSQVTLCPSKLETMKMLMKDSIHHEVTLFVLKDELKKAFCVFNKLYYHLTAFCNDIGVGACCYPKEREKLLPALVLREDKVGTNCHSSADDASTHACSIDVKMKPASFILTKFEEAHATIQEADYMLNALLEANEKSKELTGMWKQAGEDLMVEKASLVEQVEQLKQSTWLKEKENKMLREQFRHSLMEMENLVISLEGPFSEMQKYVEELFTDVCSDFLSVGRDILCCIFQSRSSLEGIFTELMEKGFAFHVFYQCHIGEILKRSSHFVINPSSFHFREQEYQSTFLTSKDDDNITRTGGMEQGNNIDVASCLEEENLELTSDNPVHENMSLRKELERKAGLLKGLLFDFTLLQESASNTKDIRDDYEKLILTLSDAQQDLERKTMRLDSILVEHEKLEEQMVNTETALFVSNSELLQAKETVEVLSDQNAELRLLNEGLCLKKSEAEEKLEEQMEIVKGLEKEVLRLASPTEAKFTSSSINIEDDLRREIYERDRLSQEVNLLNDKLEMAYALADENEAIAVEARQESEASKLYAEQREEEAKILESSVEELECTINVLEKKVYEMDEELERHQLKRDSLEIEVQALRQRILNVENIYPENAIFRQTENEISRNLPLALQEAHNRITILEEERANQNKEIKDLKDYVSELVLHADTQASLYLQKYKSLEAMVCELKIDSINSTSAAAVSDRTGKGSARTRGSSSPFRCLTSLVQQMNLEKDQELSSVKLRVDELEALASSRQKEICVLRSRLAAAESMTHDVIRDLLRVKLDMTSYANLIDQHQVQQILDQAQQQTEESVAKEQEIFNLKMQIRDLIEERKSRMSGFEERKGDLLAAEITIEKLKEREQLLSAQNDMLKRDKNKLTRRVVDLEEMVEEVFPTRDGQEGIQQQTKITESCSWRPRDADFSKRLAQSEKVLFRVNDELALYRRMSGSHLRYPAERDPLETKHRTHKVLNCPAKETESLNC